MTDPQWPHEPHGPHGPDDARAEQAFRDGLAEQADTLEPVPLEPTGRDSRWAWWAAGAAAAVVLALSATYAVTRADENPPGPDPAAAGGTEVASTQASPEPGGQVVVYRDLQVTVPAGWQRLPTPNGNGCDYPATPFVATYDPTQAFEDNLCVNDDRPRPPDGFPTARMATWSPNVQLAPVSAAAESLADGEQTFQGWTLTRRTVGDVRIEILTDASTADVVQSVLDSARSVATDPLGCDTTSPAQSPTFVRPDPAFDLASIAEVTSIAVCQYARGEGGQGGLQASTELTGDAARSEVQAVLDAPAGGGPDHPENCISDEYGDTALVLRLRDGDTALGDLYVYYDWCFGNGIDDGTTRRAVTEADCAPLFSGEVTQMSGDGSTFALCHPEMSAGGGTDGVVGQPGPAG